MINQSHYTTVNPKIKTVIMNNKYINTKSLITTIIAICLNISLLTSQTPSPAVQNAGKAAQAPINLNNGTTNFSIPIHTISDLDLNLPVSINYQTGGVRVSDVSSSIGLGWNLNAGGSVTRVVRDLPDDIYNVVVFEQNIYGYLLVMK